MRIQSKERKAMLDYSAAHGNFFPKHQRKEFLSQNQTQNNEAQTRRDLSVLTCLSCDTDASLQSSENGASLASPHFLKMFRNRFENKFKSISFREDNTNLNNSLKATQLLAIRRLALSSLKNDNLEPSEQSIAKTKEAAKDFFVLASKFLNENDELFPLADKNKCVGMATIKNNKSVFIAISQDEDATKDLRLREQFIYFLRRLNQTTTKWRFELVNTPAPMEYLLPRTLRMETPRPASSDEINPRMRCVEIHLMCALNRAHRVIKFKPEDVAMVAFSGTLWAHESESRAVVNFGNIKRNVKYLAEPALEVTLDDYSKAYIDVWCPCQEHCAIYYPEILAITSADEHFYGPRADEPIESTSWSLDRTSI